MCKRFSQGTFCFSHLKVTRKESGKNGYRMESNLATLIALPLSLSLVRVYRMTGAYFNQSDIFHPLSHSSRRNTFYVLLSLHHIAADIS